MSTPGLTVHIFFSMSDFVLQKWQNLMQKKLMISLKPMAWTTNQYVQKTQIIAIIILELDRNSVPLNKGS